MREGEEIRWGVLGCQCCAFPIVDGIPVLIADDATRAAMHAMEAGRSAEALARTARSRRRGGGPAGRVVPKRHRDLPRGARDHQPRRRGHLLRLPLLRPDVRAGRDAGARARTRWRAPGRAVIDLCGGSGHLTRVLAEREPRAGDRRRRVLLEAVAGAALHRAGLRAGVLRRQPPAAVPRRRVLDGRAVGRVPLHLAQAPAGRRDDAAGRRPRAPS